MRIDYKSLFTLALATVLVIVPFILLGDGFEQWTASSIASTDRVWLMVLIATVLLAIDAVLPIPSSVVSALVISNAGPYLGASAIWVGTLLASLLGYGIGRTARTILPEKVTPKAGKLTRRHGNWAVFVTKGVPVLGEAVALTAGAIRLPFYSFTVASAVASLFLSAAYAGTALLVPASLGQVPAMFLVALIVPLLATLLFNFFSRQRSTSVGEASETK